MAAYLALTQNIADTDRYLAEYATQMGPLFERYGIEVVAAHFGATAVEGTADSVVILRAESERVFRTFYDDPDYAGPRALRQSITSNANMVIAPEFAQSG